MMGRLSAPVLTVYEMLITKSNCIQIQYNFYQNSNDNLHRTRKKILKFVWKY